MSMDSPQPNGLLPRAFSALRGVGGNVIELAKLVLAGQATPGQITFFAIGLLGLVCIGTFIVFAALNQPVYLFITFAVLALDVLVLLCLMAWRMAPPVVQPPRPDNETLDRLFRERDQAREELAGKEAELIAAKDGLDKETKHTVLLEELRQIYEVNVDAISTHYQKVKDRFPQMVYNEVIVTINAEGAAEITERRTLRITGKKNQHFLIDQFSGTTPLASFLDLGFKLIVHSGNQVVWLPGQGKPSQHQVLFVFLPPLRAGEPDLDFSVTWNWPEVFRDLKDPVKRKDFFGTRVRSTLPVPLVRLVFRIHRSIQPIKLRNKGTVEGKETQPLPQFLSPDYRVYQWEAFDVPDEAQVAVWMDWA